MRILKDSHGVSVRRPPFQVEMFRSRPARCTRRLQSVWHGNCGGFTILVHGWVVGAYLWTKVSDR